MSEEPQTPPNIFSKAQENIEAFEYRLIQFGQRYTTVLQWLNFLFWVVIIGLIVYDVRLAGDDIDGNTWSELMRFYGRQLLILPWVFGVLIGHLFPHDDQLDPLLENRIANSPYGRIFRLTVGWFWVSIMLYGFNIQVPSAAMTLVAILGVLAGYTFWPIQRNESLWCWGEGS